MFGTNCHRRLLVRERYRVVRSGLSILSLFFCVPIASPAQAIGDPTRKGANIRVEKDVVLVPVSVVDQDNRPVRGLQGKQFHVLDNKVEQTVSSFSLDDEPLAVALVFDTSSSIGKDLNRTRLAAKAFLETANPEDEFLLVELNDCATLTVPLTNDPERIEARLASTESRGRTALLDGIYLGLTEIKKSKKTRKALLVITDGNDNHSRIAQRELGDLIPESDVMIYVIGIFAPLEFLDPVELPGARLLAWIAEQTGGRLYTGEPRKLPEIAKDIGVELRNRYVISFSPTGQEHDGRYHKVQIRITRTRGWPSMLASWRQGYYAPSD
jgi:Ca-activated chloride channel homolog